jgi:hypothetical protein
MFHGPFVGVFVLFVQGLQGCVGCVVYSACMKWGWGRRGGGYIGCQNEISSLG